METWLTARAFGLQEDGYTHTHTHMRAPCCWEMYTVHTAYAQAHGAKLKEELSGLVCLSFLHCLPACPSVWSVYLQYLPANLSGRDGVTEWVSLPPPPRHLAEPRTDSDGSERRSRPSPPRQTFCTLFYCTLFFFPSFFRSNLKTPATLLPPLPPAPASREQLLKTQSDWVLIKSWQGKWRAPVGLLLI